MYQKKIGLAILLLILSIFLGSFLSLIDIPGFFEGKSQLNITSLLISASLAYLISVVVFLLDFSDHRHLNLVFASAALLFAGSFLGLTHHLLLALASFFIYFFFLSYIYISSLKKAELFVRFSPNEIFIPSVKKGFMIMLVLLAIIAFFQTRNLLTGNNLLTPAFTKLLVKPVLPIINKEISKQIKAQLANQKDLPTSMTNQTLIRLVLKESLKNMDRIKTKDLIGIYPEQIPIESVLVNSSGDIDLAPVVDDMALSITNNMNQKYGSFIGFTPFVIGVVVFFVLQSILWPFGLLTSLITPLIFKLLFSLKFINKNLVPKEIEQISL